MNFYSDSPEWKWLFKNAIDWKNIIPIYFPKFPTEEGFKDQDEAIRFMEEVITQTGEWTGESVAARARKLDEEGAGEVVDGSTVPGEILKKLYAEATELQATGICVPKTYGGLGLPASVGYMFFTQLSQACLSSSTQIGFFTSMTQMIDKFCSESDRNKYIPMILNNQISGSMCLTEPGAGSDVGSLRTSATKQEDGTYLLNGTKCFITNGGGGLAFILARVKGAPTGVEGISMFFAQEHIDGKRNYRIAKNEHKLGMNGSFTCEIVYENTIAHIIGNENEGFRHMLYLMNIARVGTGLQALGGLEASLNYAQNYAKERKQFGKPIAELPLLKRNLDDYQTECDGIRALLVDTASWFDIYLALDMRKMRTNDLTNEEELLMQTALNWVRRRTPLVKYYGCESYTTISQRCIQVLGGYGIMKEYDAERFHRDSFAPLLYEGTSQIQALMAMKDLIKVIIKNPTKYFKSIILEHPAGQFLNPTNEIEKEFSNQHYQFKKHFMRLLIKCLKPESGNILNVKNWQNEKGINQLMVHAETICQALSYLETLRVLAKHAKIDQSREDLFLRYLTLTTPRFEAIFSDWKIR